MSEKALITTELILPDNLTIEPVQLLEPQAATSLPLEGDHVPLSMFDKEFDTVRPTLTVCGAATVRLSLDKPFGFMTGTLDRPNKTQLTHDLTLAKRGVDLRWLVAIRTEQPLSAHDEQIFALGAYKYASVAQWRIRFPSEL